MKNNNTSTSVQSAYDKQYSDRMTSWRELGGKYKSQKILEVIGDRKFDKVLDFGAGEGSVLAFLDQKKQFNELYALELSDSGIQQIKKRSLNKLKRYKEV